MADAPGTISKQISFLEAKFGNDRRLVSVLLSIATKAHTAADIEYLEKWLKRLYFASSLSGYVLQSQLLNLPITGFGSQQAVKLALAKSTEIAGKLETNLTKAMIPMTRQFLDSGTIKEGLTKGQASSAVENNLLYKTWTRVGQPKTGMKRAHSSLEGLTIPSKELFTLPSGEKVPAPHYWEISNPAAEWIWCQHQILFVSGK